MPPSTPPSFHVECVDPILNIKDMARSLDFYVNILGFTNAPWGDDNFTSISRDNKGFYLCRDGRGGPGTWIWMGFDGDIFALQEYLLSKSVTIRMPPTNFPWAYEMHIEDPDGHVIRLGTDPQQ